MKDRQRDHFRLITDYMSDLEKKHEFYIRRLKEGVGPNVMLKIEIEILRACYEVTKNPIFLWRAIETCLSAEIDFPQWITDYLFTAACKIMDSAYNSPRSKSEKDFLADALKFESSGSSNNFTKYIPTLEHYAEVAETMQKKMSSDLSFEEIEAKIANNRYPDDEDAASTMARKLRTFRENLQKIPNDLDLG
jgi:hypothetical protein